MTELRLKHLATSIRIPATSGDYIGLENVQSGTGRLLVDKLVADPAGAIAFRSGDVLFGKLRPYLRKVLVAQFGGRCSPEFLVLRPLGIDSRFLSYLLLSSPVTEWCVINSAGAKMPRTEWHVVGQVRVTAPDIGRQRAIADYLDRETARLDALIEKKQKLLELVDIRWAAMLEAAIWTLSQRAGSVEMALRRVSLLIRDGTHQPPPRVAQGKPLLSVRNMAGGRLVHLGDDSLVSDADFIELARALRPLPGDLALAIVGATLGKVAIVEDGMGPFVIQRSIAILRVDPRVASSQYIRCVLDSPRLQSILWSLVGFSAQPGIYLDSLGAIKVPVPPHSVQKAITERLGLAREKGVAMKSRIATQLDLLRERREALITAAVSGQISIPGAA